MGTKYFVQGDRGFSQSTKMRTLDQMDYRQQVRKWVKAEEEKNKTSDNGKITDNYTALHIKVIIYNNHYM